MKNAIIRGLRALVVISVTGCGAALAGEEGEPEVLNKRHALGVFVGATHAEDDYLETLGVDYGYFVNEKFEVGVVVERAVREDDSTLVIAFASLRLFGNFGIGAGIGRKDPGPDRKNTLRLSIFYDYELNEEWSLEPQFHVDFIEEEENEEVLGVAIIYRFK